MDLSGHIQDLITVANEMKNQPGLNKKALNKTVARLEEAQLWAGQINPGKINGVPETSQAINGSTKFDHQCTCLPGVVDKDCPAHGQN